MKNKFPWLLAVAAAALTGCSENNGTNVQAPTVTATNVTLTAAQRPRIQLYTVAPVNYREQIEANGVVDFDQNRATSVLAPFGGPVTQLLVPLGETVQSNQPLAVVNSPDFATAISAYRKALIVAKTDRALAELDKKLLAHHGVAQKEADQAESDAVSAEADRDAALQALVALQVDPAVIQAIQDGQSGPPPAGVIRSPIAGTLVERLITPGQLLQAGTTPCFTVADLSRVWVMTYLFGSDLAGVRVGDPAEVETGAGTNQLPGTVENIAAQVDPNTRAVLVRVAVNNPGQALKKQMYVRVHIQAQQESTGLLAPVSAILRDDENLPFVYVAQPDGSFARRHVQLGYRVGDQYVIPAGLHPGDAVVVEGGIFLQFIQAQ